MDKILHDLIYLNYGIYGTLLYLGHAEILSINSMKRCKTIPPSTAAAQEFEFVADQRSLV